jgi:nucleoside-diphosphate-sugar epimerase
MRLLVTGATGYIGAAVSRALQEGGHDVVGLARSQASASRLQANHLSAVPGDFKDAQSVLEAIDATVPDAVISTAGVSGPLGEDFKQTQNTVAAMAKHLDGSNRTLIFTSGSAVFGVFAGGNQSPLVFAEDTPLPLLRDTVAPSGAGIPGFVRQGFMAAMAARVEAEQAVLKTAGLRGMVVRPGNVWGQGGSFDLPAQIKIARKLKAAPHFGPGHTTHGYVQIDDLGQLFRLALEHGTAGEVFHGISEEASQREVAAAISRMVGTQGRTASVSTLKMLALGGPAGISLSANKRLLANHTRARLGWNPETLGVLHDIEFGSYAVGGPAA